MKNINWLAASEYGSHLLMVFAMLSVPFFVNKWLGLAVFSTVAVNTGLAFLLAKRNAQDAENAMNLLQTMFEKETVTKLGGGNC